MKWTLKYALSQVIKMCYTQSVEGNVLILVSCGVVNVIKVQHASIQFLLGLFSLWCRFTGSLVHRFMGS